MLEERGINTRTLVANQMREILARHGHFKNERSRVEHFMKSKGTSACQLMKIQFATL